MTDFADRLRRTRADRGMQQADLAAITGLEASAISHFECGRRKPSFDNLVALIEGLGVSADWLVLGPNLMRTQRTLSDDKLAAKVERLEALVGDMTCQYVAIKSHVSPFGRAVRCTRCGEVLAFPSENAICAMSKYVMGLSIRAIRDK